MLLCIHHSNIRFCSVWMSFSRIYCRTSGASKNVVKVKYSFDSERRLTVRFIADMAVLPKSDAESEKTQARFLHHRPWQHLKPFITVSTEFLAKKNMVTLLTHRTVPTWTRQTFCVSEGQGLPERTRALEGILHCYQSWNCCALLTLKDLLWRILSLFGPFFLNLSEICLLSFGKILKNLNAWNFIYYIKT